MALSCKEQGKQISTQYYSRPNVSILELRNPETVIAETLGFTGEINLPKVYSPKAQFLAATKSRIPEKTVLINVLNGLVTAEQVARRQYDELLMFPEMKPFVPDLLYIRNDEHEHEKILECIIDKLSPPPGPYKGEIYKNAYEMPKQPYLALNPKALGELYVTILDRFGEEEEKSVRSYEDFLVKVQQSKAALQAEWNKGLSGDAYNAIATPLNELERKVNKHLNEERVHLDVVDALREMFSGMKLGKVS